MSVVHYVWIVYKSSRGRTPTWDGRRPSLFHNGSWLAEGEVLDNQTKLSTPVLKTEHANWSYIPSKSSLKKWKKSRLLRVCKTWSRGVMRGQTDGLTEGSLNVSSMSFEPGDWSSSFSFIFITWRCLLAAPFAGSPWTILYFVFLLCTLTASIVPRKTHSPWAQNYITSRHNFLFLFHLFYWSNSG